MIPASYLFRTLYRARFEAMPAEGDERPDSNGHDGEARRSRTTAAIIAFISGRAAYALAGAPPATADRCR